MTPELTPELRGEIRRKLRAKYPEVRGWVFAAVRASNPEWGGAISLIGISDAARRLQEQIVPIRRDIFDLFNESWPSFVLAGEIPVFFRTLKEVCEWPEEVLAEAMADNEEDEEDEEDTNPSKEHTMRNMLSPDLFEKIKLRLEERCPQVQSWLIHSYPGGNGDLLAVEGSVKSVGPAMRLQLSTDVWREVRSVLDAELSIAEQVTIAVMFLPFGQDQEPADKDEIDEEDAVDDDDDDADEDLGACALPDVTKPLRTLTGIEVARSLGLSGPAASCFASEVKHTHPANSRLIEISDMLAFAGLPTRIVYADQRREILADALGEPISIQKHTMYLGYAAFLYDIQASCSYRTLPPLEGRDGILFSCEQFHHYLTGLAPDFRGWSFQIVSSKVAITGYFLTDEGVTAQSMLFDAVDPRRPMVAELLKCRLENVLSLCGAAVTAKRAEVSIPNWGPIPLLPGDSTALQEIGRLYNSL